MPYNDDDDDRFVNGDSGDIPYGGLLVLCVIVFWLLVWWCN